jgi:hypothetical protein
MRLTAESAQHLGGGYRVARRMVPVTMAPTACFPFGIIECGHGLVARDGRLKSSSLFSLYSYPTVRSPRLNVRTEVRTSPSCGRASPRARRDRRVQDHSEEHRSRNEGTDCGICAAEHLRTGARRPSGRPSQCPETRLPGGCLPRTPLGCPHRPNSNSRGPTTATARTRFARDWPRRWKTCADLAGDSNAAGMHKPSVCLRFASVNTTLLPSVVDSSASVFASFSFDRCR